MTGIGLLMTLTSDLENIISACPKCNIYLCKFWFKSIQRFRSYYSVHKISMAVAVRP